MVAKPHIVNPPVHPLEIFNVARDWHGKPVPEMKWTLPGIIPHRQVTMLSGDGGVGKSYLAMTLMCALATGNRFLGVQGEQIPVLGVFCEDEKDVLHHRQAKIAETLGWDTADMTEVHYTSLVGKPQALGTYEQEYKNQRQTVDPLYGQIVTAAKELGAQFVVIDNLYNVFHGNENERWQATSFINLLRQMAIDIDGSVLLCAHPSRSGMADGSGVSGSTAWHNAVRSRLYLTYPDVDDKSKVVLNAKKNNYGPDDGKFYLTKYEGVPVYEVPDDLQGGAIGGMAKRSAQRSFLDAMKSALKSGQHLSPKARASNYAPRILVQYQSGVGGKFDHRQLENAMHSLLKDEYLRVEAAPGSRDRQTEIIILTEKGQNGYAG